MNRHILRLPVVALLFCPCAAFSSEIVHHEWEADIQTEGGVPKTCYLGLNALNSDLIAVTMSLSMVVRHKGPDRIGTWTLLKVRTARLVSGTDQQGPKLLALSVNNAWIRSGTKTTVGKLSKLPPETGTEAYYLGGTGGMDLFLEMVDSILVEGITLGVQEKPGDFDRIFRVSSPPDDKTARNYMACLATMQELAK